MATESKVKVLLTASDELTPQLKKCEASLQTLTSKADKLEKIQKDFDKITNSTKPLRQQLKQLQTLMANMNLDGLDNTPLFTQMAERAGTLADAMGDARQAVNAFANDNFKLEAMAQGMTLVASAGSIATGAMGLFGTENEKVTQAILKVQSALAILNGVQSVANALNKDSALMLRLKQIRMVASTKTTISDTVATSANSVSMGANTVATTLAQKAREKLNYTIALGKALMGDWTGLLLVGAAALTTYAIATSSSNDKLEKSNEKLNESQTSYSKYQDEVGKATANITSKMTILQTQWGALRSEAEKTQWIKENKSAFDEMGISINNVYEAEELFVKHTNEVVNAMIARAKAQASANKLTNDETERDNKIREINKKYDNYIDDKIPVKKGETITVKKANELGINSDNSKIYHNVSSEDISRLNQKYSEEGERLRQQEIQAINAQYDHIKKENIDLVRESAEAVIDAENEVSKYFKKGSKEKSTTTQKGKKEEIIDVDSLKYAEQQLKKFQDEEVKIPIDATDKLKENKQKINYWEKEVERRKINIELSTKYDDEKLKQFQSELSDLYEKRININVNADDSELKELNKQIDIIENKINEKLSLGVKTDDKELISLRKELTGLKNKKVDILVSYNLKNNKEINSQIEETNKKIQERKDYLISIDKEDLIETDDELTILNNHLKELEDKIIISTNSDRLKEIDSEIEKVQNEINKINELKVSVNDDEIRNIDDEIFNLQNLIQEKYSIGVNADDSEIIKLENKVNELLEKKNYLLTVSTNENELTSLNKQLTELTNKKNEIKLSSNADEVDKEIRDKLNEIQSRKLEILLSTGYDDSNLNGLKQHLKELEDFRLIISPDDEATISLLNAEIEKEKKIVENTEIKLGIKPIIEEGSKSYLESEISKITTQLSNMDIKANPDKFNDLYNKLIELTKKAKELDDALDVTAKPSIYYKEDELIKGNKVDKSQSYDNAMSQIDKVGNYFSKGIINKDEAESEIKRIVEELQSLIPDLQIKIKVKEDGTIETIKKESISTADAITTAGQAINSMGQALGTLANDNEALAKTALIASAIGQLTLSYAQAMSQAAALGPIGWITMALTGMGVLTTLVAQMQSFADGGIVQGSSFIGDRTLVRANAGEMILNRKQQNNLYKAIKNDDFGNGNIGGNVTFTIDGTTLKGVLNNTNRKINRQS